MASGAQVVLTAATATLVATAARRQSTDVTITNSSGAALFVGGASVTNTVYGQSIASTAVQTIRLAPRDTLYAYSVGGGTIGVFSSP